MPKSPTPNEVSHGLSSTDGMRVNQIVSNTKNNVLYERQEDRFNLNSSIEPYSSNMSCLGKRDRRKFDDTVEWCSVKS